MINIYTACPYPSKWGQLAIISNVPCSTNDVLRPATSLTAYFAVIGTLRQTSDNLM